MAMRGVTRMFDDVGDTPNASNRKSSDEPVLMVVFVSKPRSFWNRDLRFIRTRKGV